MTDLPTLCLPPNVCAEYGLANIAYPVRLEALKDAVGKEGHVPFAELLYGLQETAAEGDSDWQGLEPAMARLTELVGPADERAQVLAEGDTWWIEIGPVDLEASLVTVQRGDRLLAAVAPREDGRLRVAAFRPLDSKSLGYLTGLSQIPHPEHGVCMRENNWEYAKDCSAQMGNVYADQRGQAYLSAWAYGLGVSSDGRSVPEWHEQRTLEARRPASVAVELGVHYTLTHEQDST